MKYTDSQEKAINSRNKTLLISAGAGSGKTSVLTTRILNRIIEGADIDNFLVVTYTKSAVLDMRAKLTKLLSAASAQMPENNHIRTQLVRLPFAQITTINSFCMDLIKSDFATLGLPAKIRVADDCECDTIRACVFDELAEESSPEYIKLGEMLPVYCNEDTLFSSIEKIYDSIRSYPDYINWFENAVNRLKSDSTAIKSGGLNTVSYKNVIYTYVKSKCSDALTITDDIYEQIINSACENAGVLSWIELYIKNVTDGIEFLTNEKPVSAIEELKKALAVRASVKSLDSELSAYVKTKKSAANAILNSSLQFLSSAVFDNVYEEEAEFAECLLKVIKKFDILYKAEKRSRGVVDFQDQEHLAASLLIKNGERTNLCRQLRDKYTEIFIDEYQDVNPLQESIFGALAKETNRFMVGDVKQSIYRFRNAYPDLFNGYKESFPDYPAESSDKARLFLRENFRCDKYIIDFVNMLFTAFYTKQYSGEELIYAKQTDMPPVPVTVALFVRESKAELEEQNRVYEPYVCEARYIANEIQTLMQTAKGEDGEPIKYSDIAILFSQMKDVSEIYIRVLREAGIPVKSEKTQPLFSRPEVKAVVASLLAIDNPLDDISLSSFMRSFVFDFTTDELYLIRLHNDETPLYSSVYKAAYGEERKKGRRFRCSDKKLQNMSCFINVTHRLSLRNNISPILKQKCRNFLERLSAFREKAASCDVAAFVRYFYYATAFVQNVGAESDGLNKRRNVLSIYNMARNYSSSDFKTLSFFADKLREQYESKDTAISAASSESGNSVTLMTIHKSKGLEFPVVFLTACGKQFISKRKSNITVRYSDGIFASRKLRDFTYGSSLLKIALTESERIDLISEEARKLYVALTRARRILYVTGTPNESDIKKRLPPSRASNFLQWIIPAISEKNDDETVFNKTGFMSVSVFGTDIELTKLEKCETQEKTESMDLNAVKAALEASIAFKYPYEASTQTPVKLSVSELRSGLLEDTEYSRKLKKSDFTAVPSFAQETESASFAGISNHLFMQFASFETVEERGVEYEAERLLEKGIISNEQFQTLSFPRLRMFFDSSLYKEMRSSHALFREKRFNISIPASLIEGMTSSPENVLIQGVIDCFFERSDGTYTIVDYKTDSVKEGDESLLINRHKTQLSLYKTAVEQMTEKPVSAACIYSFALGKAVYGSFD